MNANATTNTNTFAGKTADEWRAMAATNRKASADSFERCDTDGFLSQWAADTMAQRYMACADVAENGGRIEISAAFLLDGTLASIDYREGKFGWYYLINDAAEKVTGVRFWSPSGARKAATRTANNAKKGFSEGTVSVPAYLDRKTDMIHVDYKAAKAGDVVIVSTDAYQTKDN